MAPRPAHEGGIVARGRAWPRLFAYLLLLCLMVQGTVVQSHVHFLERASLFGAPSGSRHVLISGTGTRDKPAVCPLCQEAAMAGAYVAPPAVLLPSPPAPVLWVAAAGVVEFALAPPALGWLSRAPPE